MPDNRKKQRLQSPQELLAQMRTPHKEEKAPEDVPRVTVIEVRGVRGFRGKVHDFSVVYTVPSMGERIQIAGLVNAYMPAGSVATPGMARVTEMICYLTVCCSFNDAHPQPDWWDPFSTFHMEPYQTLYGRCLEHEASFHGEDAPGQRLGGEDQQGNPVARDGGASVVSEVQAAAQRRETLAGDGA
jgi:hypothetical protein